MTEESIFFEALHKQTPESRAAFLEKACAGSTALRRDVESLLRAYERAGSFLEGASHSEVSADNDLITEKPGTIIGPYKLLEQIGEGGFGIIFMAEQEQPIHRKVAVKVLKPGLDTHQVIARFEAERQALAMMNHFNIAHVFGGGETASGRPYFVMELVRGIPITDFCNRHRSSMNERLDLFISVCRAVQHAHQKGVIHRDLKPSNVLVTMHDELAVVKVIDFGIAKAIGQKLTEKTLFTNFAQMIGTPMYMSPEQAQLSGLDVDTRSDIYSLGVLLYELLTEITPFDKERLRTASFDEIRRIIQEEEPVRPSAHVSTMAKAATTVPTRQGNDPRQLSQLFRAELDWIVMKCLDKNRDRRYETVNSLVQDIERYQRNEPVQACPPSTWYQWKKFCRRNQAKVAIVSLCLILLALLATGLGWIAWERNSRSRSTSIAVQAALEEAKGLLLQGRWREGQMTAQRAGMLLANELADAKLQQEACELLRDFRMCARLEEVRILPCNIKDGHFDSESADHGYAVAFRDYGIDVEALDRDEAAKRIKERAIAVELAAALDGWATIKRQIKKKNNKNWRELVQLAGAADPDPQRKAIREALLKEDLYQLSGLSGQVSKLETPPLPPGTLVLLADTLADLGDLNQAISLLRRAQENYAGDFWINHQFAIYLSETHPPRLEEAIRYFSTAVGLRPDSVGARLNLGEALAEKGYLEEAIATFRKIIELKPDYAEAHCNLGLELATQGRLDEALIAVRRALELKPDLPQAHNNLGVVLQKQRHIDEAIAAYRRAIELSPRQAKILSDFGSALIDKGDLDEAIAVCQQAIELVPTHAEAYDNLGLALLRKGKIDDALEACRRAIELKPDFPRAHFNLGLALVAQDQLNEALIAYRQAAALKPDYAEAHCNLGAIFYRLGRLNEALESFRRATELEPDFVLAQHNLGCALKSKGQLEEAVKVFRRVIALKPDAADAYYELGHGLSDLGQVEKAIEAYRRTIVLKPDFAEAHCNLGLSLRQQGEFSLAFSALKRGHELGTRLPKWNYPSAQWVKECQRLADLEAQLPAIVRGDVHPANAEEMIEFAQLCYYKKHFALATRWWANAFTISPEFTADVASAHRYYAACAAVMAASGSNSGDDHFNAQECARWRKQALEWLQAELAVNGKLLTSSKPEERGQALYRLRYWQREPQLAAFRDKEELAKLPDTEQAACKQFWAEVQGVLTKADQAKSAH